MQYIVYNILFKFLNVNFQKNMIKQIKIKDKNMRYILYYNLLAGWFIKYLFLNL